MGHVTFKLVGVISPNLLDKNIGIIEIGSLIDYKCHLEQRGMSKQLMGNLHGIKSCTASPRILPIHINLQLHPPTLQLQPVFLSKLYILTILQPIDLILTHLRRIQFERLTMST
jgi:hypothetical protein